jgi:MFS family permease
MTAASALFVAAGAIGMSVGPLMAAILDITAGRNNNVDLKLPWLPAGGIIFNHMTAPGFVMASLWLLELLALILLFREPERINGSGTQKKRMARFESETEVAGKGNNSNYGTGSLPLTPRVQYGPHSAMGVWQSVWSQMTMVKKLVFDNMALPVTFLLFGYIELVDEVLISSCAMVCYKYFNWHASRAGLLIASLGALVLPAHYVVERASRRYKERTIMKVRAKWYVCGRNCVSETHVWCLHYLTTVLCRLYLCQLVCDTELRGFDL